jgi:hypothetical protein
MKNQLSNPIKYNKIVVIEALFMTILVHALFFVCFSSKSTLDDVAGERKPSVTLLNISNMSREDLQKFKQFLKFNDPSMFSSSVNSNGYSEILLKKNGIVFEDCQIDNSNMVKYVANYERSRLPEKIEMQEVEKAMMIDKIANISRDSTADSSPIKYPIAIGNDGSQIPLIFSQDELQALERHNIGNTIIRIKRDKDGVSRLHIVQSSGQRNFDLLSYRLLYRLMQEQKDIQATFYTIYYQEGQL